MMRRGPSFILALSFLLATSSSARAWWNQGHEHITRASITHLPEPLKSYFAANEHCLALRAGTEPPGTHFIDIDFYPEFFSHTFPRNLNDLIALYGASTVNANGTGPWTAANYVTTLSSQMASATTANDWHNLLATAAALAHYFEDLHNPLHLTLNYNGQMSGNFGIHARYEGEMVLRHLNDLVIAPSPANCVLLTSPIDTIFDGIDLHYYFLDDILAADTAHRGGPPYVYGNAYYNGMWADTGTFTHELFRKASYQVASAWYTAWINAGSPTPIYSIPGDFDGNGLSPTDIPTFVNEMLNPSISSVCRADMNADGALNGRDIGLFVAALMHP